MVGVGAGRQLAGRVAPIGRLTSAPLRSHAQAAPPLDRGHQWGARGTAELMMQFTPTHTHVAAVEDTLHDLRRADATIAALGRAVRSTQAARILVEGGAIAVGATSGVLVLLTDARRTLKLVHRVGVATESLSPERRLQLSARFPLVDAVRSRREVWLASPEERRARYPELESEPGTSAWAVLPLMVGSVVLGAVGWGLARPLDDLTDGDRACLRTLARAGADAIYRTGLYDFERRARADLEIARFNLASDVERLKQECQRREAFLAEANTILESATDSSALVESDRVPELATARRLV